MSSTDKIPAKDFLHWEIDIEDPVFEYGFLFWKIGEGREREERSVKIEIRSTKPVSAFVTDPENYWLWENDKEYCVYTSENLSENFVMRASLLSGHYYILVIKNSNDEEVSVFHNTDWGRE